MFRDNGYISPHIQTPCLFPVSLRHSPNGVVFHPSEVLHGTQGFPRAMGALPSSTCVCCSSGEVKSGPVLPTPSLTTLLSVGQAALDRQEGKRGPLSGATGTSTFECSTTNCAMLANVRPTPTRSGFPPPAMSFLPLFAGVAIVLAAKLEALLAVDRSGRSGRVLPCLSTSASAVLSTCRGRRIVVNLPHHMFPSLLLLRHVPGVFRCFR